MDVLLGVRLVDHRPPTRHHGLLDESTHNRPWERSEHAGRHTRPIDSHDLVRQFMVGSGDRLLSVGREPGNLGVQDQTKVVDPNEFHEPDRQLAEMHVRRQTWWDLSQDLVDQRRQITLDQLNEEVLLRREMLVKRRATDVGFRRDVGVRRLGVAVLTKELRRGIEELFAVSHRRGAS